MTKAAIEDLEADGGLDILVNAAGARDRRPLGGLDAAALRKLVDVNLVGAFTLSRAVAPQMRARGGGRIIHVSPSPVTSRGRETRSARRRRAD